MARVLAALNQIEIRDQPQGANAPRSEAPACPAPEEVPFIEIGGARLEGSASVLGTKISTPAIRSPRTETPAVLFRPVASGCPFASVKERFAPELVAVHQPDHTVSRQYRELANRLIGGSERETQAGRRALLFSGALGEVDTTAVVLNLAVTFARAGGSRVVVVDAAGAAACVAQKLGLLPAPGLQEVLAGGVPLPRALQETGVLNFQVVAAGELGDRPCLPVRSLRDALSQLRKRGNLVLVNAPAWEQGAEQIAGGAGCDATYLVVPRAQADAPELNELLSAISRRGVTLCGCVLA
jgi:Mrp family chromosome partitioning ATPase